MNGRCFGISRSLLGCLALATCVGCGQPTAEFRPSAASEKLIPDAKTELTKTLNEMFGTPNELVAWDRLPIQYHGARAAVVAGDSGPGLAFERPFGVVHAAKNQPLFWLTGGNQGSQAGAVGDVNAQTGAATLWGVDGAAEGDLACVEFGANLSLGRTVYMKNCMHCHGTTGDGDGPTAKYLNPRPRDYRQGVFKFKSTQGPEKATRADLHRTVAYGVPGTYMPSFLLLGEKETEAVVEYVRWLALRGEIESQLTNELVDFSMASIDESVKQSVQAFNEAKKAGEKAEPPVNAGQAKRAAQAAFGKFKTDDWPGLVDEATEFISGRWTRAEEAESVIWPKVARVADTAESREKGRVMYLSDKLKCYTCHGELGYGDGPATEDFWKKPGSSENYEKRGLHDDWGYQLKPRNLRLGQYRGGRRPVDVFRKIYAGIKGGPMPGFGGTSLQDEEIWHIVNYVMSLPFDDASKSGGKPSPRLASGAR